MATNEAKRLCPEVVLVSGEDLTPYRHASKRVRQGLTLAHLSAQLERFWWDKGYLGGVKGVFKAGLEGVFMRLGGVECQKRL